MQQNADPPLPSPLVDLPAVELRRRVRQLTHDLAMLHRDYDLRVWELEAAHESVQEWTRKYNLQLAESKHYYGLISGWINTGKAVGPDEMERALHHIQAEAEFAEL